MSEQPETLPAVLHGFRHVKRIDPARVRWATPAEQEAFNRGLAEGRRQATEGKRLVVEWGARVDEPHPARHEKAGDVIKLGVHSARHAPTIWAGWTTVRRELLVGPWEPDPATSHAASTISQPWEQQEPDEQPEAARTGRDCPRCGKPTTGFTGEPVTEMANSNGYVETLSYSRTFLPCGCTKIIDARPAEQPEGGA